VRITATRFLNVSMIAFSLTFCLAGCGSVSEKDKEAAEKVPDLEIESADPAAEGDAPSDSAPPEKKESVDGEADKE
jgi:hypothetical protein